MALMAEQASSGPGGTAIVVSLATGKGEFGRAKDREWNQCSDRNGWQHAFPSDHGGGARAGIRGGGGRRDIRARGGGVAEALTPRTFQREQLRPD
jgi:hypothetical protein